MCVSPFTPISARAHPATKARGRGGGRWHRKYKSARVHICGCAEVRVRTRTGTAQARHRQHTPGDQLKAGNSAHAAPAQPAAAAAAAAAAARPAHHDEAPAATPGARGSTLLGARCRPPAHAHLLAHGVGRSGVCARLRGRKKRSVHPSSVRRQLTASPQWPFPVGVWQPPLPRPTALSDSRTLFLRLCARRRAACHPAATVAAPRRRRRLRCLSRRSRLRAGLAARRRRTPLPPPVPPAVAPPPPRARCYARCTVCHHGGGCRPTEREATPAPRHPARREHPTPRRRCCCRLPGRRRRALWWTPAPRGPSPRSLAWLCRWWCRAALWAACV
jgi:hypothetical protein